MTERRNVVCKDALTRKTSAPRALSDDDLLRRVGELLERSRCAEAELVAHLAEVDARRLYAREACGSMFTYCTERLHLSEAEAYLRIAVARASRQHPMLLEMLADGRLHQSGIAKLAPHLTGENRDEVLRQATHKSKRQIEEIVAALKPRPDVPGGIRRLPESRSSAGGGSSGAAAARQQRPGAVPGATSAASASEQRPGAVPGATSAGGASEQRSVPAPLSHPCAVAPAFPDSGAGIASTSEAKPFVLSPLSPGRYKLELTATAGLRDKLLRLRALMRSQVPDGDLATLLEDAVSEKLERLEARRFGKSKRPRKTLESSDTSASSRYIPVAVKRAVCERDDDRCSFVDEQGRRCSEREGLEFHHEDPFARGGEHRLDNVRLRCRAHNLLAAELDYGKEQMALFRKRSSKVSEPKATYRPAGLSPSCPALPSRTPFEAFAPHSTRAVIPAVPPGAPPLPLWQRRCSPWRSPSDEGAGLRS